MSNQGFYSITVRRFTLRCSHSDWLVQTQTLYNEVILFYYQLFLSLEEREEIYALNSQQTMRRLEVLTIEGREKIPVKYPLPFPKLPLYFRRAAINTAVTAAKSFLNRQDSDDETKEKTKSFHCAVTFYKGAYRELTESSIQLKTWTGKQWKWLSCRLSGNSFLPQAEIMSPSLISKGNIYYMNLPFKEVVEDGRKAKERIEQHNKVCSISFTNGDTLAVAVILNHREEQVNVRFFRGGAEYAHRCRQILERIASSEKKMGKETIKNKRIQTDYISGNLTEKEIAKSIEKNLPGIEENRQEIRKSITKINKNLSEMEENILGIEKNLPEIEKNFSEREEPIPKEEENIQVIKETISRERQPHNQKYWMKLKHISEHYAHNCSKQIVEYCLEQQAKILIIPEYNKNYTKYVMNATGNWSPVHLSKRIRSQLSYKAWKAGIVVLEVSAQGCANTCAQCHAVIHKKGNDYWCENGHKGNRYLNTARNLGCKCLRSFRRTKEIPREESVK